MVSAGANREALAVAQASGAEFIRAEGFVFSHVGDEGWMDSCAGQLLRHRRAIGAEEVMIWTDINKKHWYVVSLVFPEEVRVILKYFMGWTGPHETLTFQISMSYV